MMNSVFIYLQLLKKRVIIIIVEKDKTNILFEVRRGNMKKSIILKSFLVILTCVMLIFAITYICMAIFVILPAIKKKRNKNAE